MNKDAEAYMCPPPLKVTEPMMPQWHCNVVVNGDC
jgi:hypothetical protein